MIDDLKQAVRLLKDRIASIPEPECQDAVERLSNLFEHEWGQAGRPILCARCSQATDHSYALLDSLWLEIWPTRRGVLCLPCVEALLGRHLLAKDFKTIRMNATLLYFLRRYDP